MFYPASCCWQSSSQQTRTKPEQSTARIGQTPCDRRSPTADVKNLASLDATPVVFGKLIVTDLAAQKKPQAVVANPPSTGITAPQTKPLALEAR
jgi:hypothetical protein